MVKISIVCLIYKSPQLADWVYDSLYEFTPMLHTGEAEFFFVANDPEEDLLAHLINKGYPFILNNNIKLSEAELFELGYGKPEYMSRVYKGYNQGIIHAKGQKVVLINSDNYFSPDWLENLLKYSEYKNIICSTLVEPGHDIHPVFPSAFHVNFGKKVSEFKKDDFLKFTSKIKKTGLKYGGAYMPCIFNRNLAFYAGLYPEGNLAKDSFDEIFDYGDKVFYQKLLGFGIKHYTAKDSIVYHLKEGEKDDVIKFEKIKFYKNSLALAAIEKCKEYKPIPKINASNLETWIMPTDNHSNIINNIQMTFLAITPANDNFNNMSKTIESILIQKSNMEIMIVDESNNIDKYRYLNDKYGDKIKYIHNSSVNDCEQLDKLVKQSEANFIMFLDKNKIYVENKLSIQKKVLLGNDYNNTILVSYSKEEEKESFINISACVFPRKIFDLYKLENVFNRDYAINLIEGMRPYNFVCLNEDLIYNLSETGEVKKEQASKSRLFKLARKTRKSLKKDGIWVTGKKGIKKILSKAKSVLE